MRIMLKNPLPAGFTYVDDPRLILDISYATNDNFLGRQVAGYNKPVCILTDKAKKALLEVQDDLDALNKGYRLRIYDAYRPTEAVQDFIRWAKETENPEIKHKYYPNFEKHQLFEVGYIAPINSTHSRGSTVDLTISYPSSTNPEEYENMNMGTIFDFFDERSHTQCDKISEEAKQNRKFLLEIMAKHHFVNYDKEWWHFTLDDEPFPETYFNFPVR